MSNTAVKHHLKENIFMRQETHFAPQGGSKAKQPSANFYAQLSPLFLLSLPLKPKSQTHPKYRRSHIQGLRRDGGALDARTPCGCAFKLDSESPRLRSGHTLFLSWLAAANTT